MARTVTAALTVLVLAGCMSSEAARNWDQAGLGIQQAAAPLGDSVNSPAQPNQSRRGAPARTVYYGNYGYPMAFCRQMHNGTVYCW
ncbi:MAG TPA: hypothetical protein VHI72_10310 [Hyphomicrobiaceae bacterium]|nr:hypothetical protein [Hyphomicrobiaceae bacterium]